MGPQDPGIAVGYATWRCVGATTHHHHMIHAALGCFSKTQRVSIHAGLYVHTSNMYDVANAFLHMVDIKG